MINHRLQYSDVLVMDVTYKCNVNDYSLLNIMCIDSNGHLVFHAFLFYENSIFFIAVFESFTSCYDSNCTKTIFIEKSMNELIPFRLSKSIFVHFMC